MQVAIWYDKNKQEGEELMIVTSMNLDAELEKIILDIDPEKSVIEQVKLYLEEVQNAVYIKRWLYTYCK